MKRSTLDARREPHERQTLNFPKKRRTQLCADLAINPAMLSSDQILEEAARDGSIDVLVPPHPSNMSCS